MLPDLIKAQLKTVEGALRSSFAVFSFTNSTVDTKSLSSSIDALSKTILFMHDVVIETGTDLSVGDMTIKRMASNQAEYSEDYFKPHVSVGSSPFLPYFVKNKLVGVLVRMQQKNVVFCRKTISRLARELFERAYINDESLSMKQAKKSIVEQLQQANSILRKDVPLVDSYSDVCFYIDFKNHVILAKNGHRTHEAINFFFSLLLKVGKSLKTAHSELELELDALLTSVFKERLDIQAFSTYALAHHKAFGAYQIQDVVNFYSDEESKNDEAPLPMLPTDTVGFVSELKSPVKIEFKNAIGYFLNHGEETLPSYRTLKTFADNHLLKASSIRVEGEIPMPKVVERYLTAHPDAKDGELSGQTLTICYDTKASEGNIIFKVNQGTEWFFHAALSNLLDEVSDKHWAKKQVEPLILKEMGDMLELLHESSSLFIEFYIRANKVNHYTETAVDQDLKKAIDDSAVAETTPEEKVA